MARETWVQSQVESYQRLKKMVLDASLLNTQHHKVRIKGKVEQSREGVAPSPTHWCSSYRKGSLRVTLDYGRQLYFTYTFLLHWHLQLYCQFQYPYFQHHMIYLGFWLILGSCIVFVCLYSFDDFILDKRISE